MYIYMPLQSYKIKLVSEQFKFTTLYIRQIKLKPKPANVRKAILFFFFLLNILDGVGSLGSRMT